MESKTDIWMPLAIGDYLADTSHLDTTQHGAYLLLLMHYWRKGPLPNDPAQLANICKLSRDAWSTNEAVLMQFFTVGPDGRLHQKRSDREREKSVKIRISAQEKASKAARARWNHASSIATEMLEQCPLPKSLPKPSEPVSAASHPENGEEKESPPRSGKNAFLPPAAKAFSDPGSLTDEAWMIARAVIEETAITNTWVTNELVRQAELELKIHPGDMDGIRDGMVAAWKAYMACAKAGKLRMTPMSAQKFYGDGIWKSSSMWGLKKGMKAYEGLNAA